jgi:hypothetical protein
MKSTRDQAGGGELTPLEKSVLAALLVGEGAALTALRIQIHEAEVISRTHSGVGFVTKLRVPDTVPELNEEAERSLARVYAEHPQLEGAAEFLLQLKRGRINCLEAYCYQGMWPADESLFRVVQPHSRVQG